MLPTPWLPVTLEPDPKSKMLAQLGPGTVVQQCGDVVRLPSGEQRVPIKFKRQALHTPHEEEDAEYIELHAGYWGSSGRPADATTVKVYLNGIIRTFAFNPGAAEIEGVPHAINIGFTPATNRYHLLSLTIRQTGTHTFSIQDGCDPTKSGWCRLKAVHCQSFPSPLHRKGCLPLQSLCPQALMLPCNMARACLGYRLTAMNPQDHSALLLQT